MKLPKELTTVTPLSKYFAMILFIALPFIGFFMGMNYQSTLDLSSGQQTDISTRIIKPSPTPTPETKPDSTDSSEIDKWSKYINNRYGYSISLPQETTILERKFLGVSGKNEIETTFKITGENLVIYGNGGGMGVNPIKIKTITIGGIKTDKYYTTMETREVIIKAIRSPQKDDEIYFHFSLPDDQTKAQDIDNLMDQILSTFRFAD